MMTGNFGTFHTRHAFSSRVEVLAHQLMATYINLRDNVMRLVYLLNYVLSTKAE